jgi:hypothetical protein
MSFAAVFSEINLETSAEIKISICFQGFHLEECTLWKEKSIGKNTYLRIFSTILGILAKKSTFKQCGCPLYRMGG